MFKPLNKLGLSCVKLRAKLNLPILVVFVDLFGFVWKVLVLLFGRFDLIDLV